MRTTASREEQLVRASKLRALIIGYLNTNAQTMAVTRSDMVADLSDQLKELGYKESAVDNFLYVMSKDLLIGKAAKQGTKVTYCSKDSSLATNIPYRKKAKDRDASTAVVVTKKSKSSRVPEISLDYVKSSNRVRLTINGLVIEIGVVD